MIMADKEVPYYTLDLNEAGRSIWKEFQSGQLL